MLLKDYIPNIDKKYNRISFSGLAFESSKVKKDNIFFAIKGNNFDGNNFIQKAIQKGARVIISEKNISIKKRISYLLKLKMLENYLQKYHIKL